MIGLWQQLVVKSAVNRLNGALSVTPERCVNMLHKRSGCSACLDVCPTGAIQVGRPGSTVFLDQNLCQGCEQCVSACTGEVFTRPVSVIDWCRKLMEYGSELTIGCHRVKATDGHLTCLGGIHPVEIFYLISYGVRKITFTCANCNTCGWNGRAELGKALAPLLDLCKQHSGIHLAQTETETELVLTAQGAAPAHKTQPIISRRQLFTRAKREMLQSVAEVLNGVDERSAPNRGLQLDQGLSPRVVLLRQALKRCHDGFAKQVRFADCFPLARIEQKAEQCRRCGVCVRICPQHVFELRGEEKQEPRSLIIHNANCNGCGICVTACLSKRLKMCRIFDLEELP